MSPQGGGRNAPEWVAGINRNRRPESIGISGRNASEYAQTLCQAEKCEKSAKIAFRRSLGFQVQIEDLHLKCCILMENPKNNITGSTLHAQKCLISPPPPKN